MNNFGERRRQADWVANAATILSVVSWAIALAVVIILDFAAPGQENLMTVIFEEHVRREWEVGMLPIAFWLLVGSFVICIGAFIFNAMRMRRKTDRFKKSIFIIGVINFFGIIFFLFRFGQYLV